jgi:hypothetical protein
MAWVKTYPLFFGLDFWHSAASMFLRSTERKKDGKAHRYFSVVENRRLPGSRTVPRTVLYLGEINDQQQAAWRKTLDVFDEDEQDYRTMSLFPDDREVPADVLDSIQVKLSGLELRRPRTFGACWLGCGLWHQPGLDEFWQQRLPEGRKAVSWACRYCDGRVVRNGLRRGRQGPAVSLSGWGAAAQTGVVCLVETEVGRLVRRGL